MHVPITYRTCVCMQVNYIGVVQVSLESLGNAGTPGGRREGAVRFVCASMRSKEPSIPTRPSNPLPLIPSSNPWETLLLNRSLSPLRAILDYENFRGTTP
ncbi:hypothetical protein BDQ12DRAFT_685746 [Crucibulum laeve]|uniref:Uncharacterized protein n=1 Tax=Crucibulum laeve TaxID=68775 RepID=A0A5C3LWY8_9AGAR|nr:hypothetical protein BDQ12DRAFT_685746 [Crucibulum laeve]